MSKKIGDCVVRQGLSIVIPLDPSFCSLTILLRIVATFSFVLAGQKLHWVFLSNNTYEKFSLLLKRRNITKNKLGYSWLMHFEKCIPGDVFWTPERKMPLENPWNFGIHNRTAEKVKLMRMNNIKSLGFSYLVPKFTKIRRVFNDLAYSPHTLIFFCVGVYSSFIVNESIL